jgi:hypothetical protein
MRPGTPGRAYPNRTDLATQPSLPARVATNQTYGRAQAQLQAQRQIPMAPPPTLIPPAGGPTGGPPSLPGATSPPAPPAGVPAPLPPAPNLVPGGAGPLERATERPNEPVTAGASLGPGPGPESMAGPTVNLAGILGRAAQTTGSSVLAALAQRAGIMNQ